MSGSKSRGRQPKLDGAAQSGATNGTSRVTKDRYAEGYDHLLLNSPIEYGVLPRVMKCVSENRKNKKVILTLVTYGGIAEEAYRIGRYLQSAYDDIVVSIPAACKSAGTLLVTAANTLVMGPFGELGPLDVQLRQKDEIMGRRSGLITRAALSDLKAHSFEIFEYFALQIVQSSGGSISFRMAADIAARTTGEMMSKIYGQINPDTLGQSFRDLNVATEYCERLNRKFRNTKQPAVHRLVHDYSAHDFVIDYEEAKELFARVELPSKSLYLCYKGREIDLAMPYDASESLVQMVVVVDGEDSDAEVIEDAGAVVDASESTLANGRDA